MTNDYNPFPGNARAAANLGKGITGVFTHYFRRLNAYRCSSAEHVGILCADVAKAFNGEKTNENAFAKGLIGTDEFNHPSAKGHRLIAQILRALGYRPLVDLEPATGMGEPPAARADFNRLLGNPDALNFARITPGNGD